jgi:fructokinase
MASGSLYGGIEAGGTKFICVVGRGPRDLIDEARISTTEPMSTLRQVVRFFEPYCSEEGVAALGVGSFGPLDLDESSPTYGRITSTPKRGWQNADILGSLRSALRIPVVLDTDVNAAALGEHTWGAAIGLRAFLYLTVGTGIGGAFLYEGKALRGLQHAEMGHVRIARDSADQVFGGACPYHGACFEGLASGPAIQKRLGCRPEELPDDDPFWSLEAGYIASALATYVLVLSPMRIILGGGVMRRQFLLPMIRARLLALLGNYVIHPQVVNQTDTYVVAPALDSYSGVYGALVLAAGHAARLK